jgi:prophage regulatory protein
MLKFHKIKGLVAMTSDGRSTCFDRVREGLLPTPIALGPKSKVWAEHEVQEVLRARLAGWDEDRIRVLVREIIARRQSLDVRVAV